MRRTAICLFLLLACPAPVVSQTAAPAEERAGSGGFSTIVNSVFDYLEMAGTKSASDFHPLDQHERNVIYGKSLINPILYLKAAMSAGFDQKNNKPHEWGQGASGYGTRFGNIMGQYAIHRTTTYGLASLLHEDNRYFGSGQKGFWRRAGYAASSSILARHDDGRRYPSISQVGGFAAGAFISRAWQPPSTRSAGDGAVSFGLSMGYNVLACEVKEFLPDIMRPLMKSRKPSPTPSPNDHPGAPAN